MPLKSSLRIARILLEPPNGLSGDTLLTNNRMYLGYIAAGKLHHRRVPLIALIRTGKDRRAGRLALDIVSESSATSYPVSSRPYGYGR